MRTGDRAYALAMILAKKSARPPTQTTADGVAQPTPGHTSKRIGRTRQHQRAHHCAKIHISAIHSSEASLTHSAKVSACLRGFRPRRNFRAMRSKAWDRLRCLVSRYSRVCCWSCAAGCRFRLPVGLPALDLLIEIVRTTDGWHQLPIHA